MTKHSQHTPNDQPLSKVPASTNPNVINRFKRKQKKMDSATNMAATLLQGDTTMLSRAITLIESTQQKHFNLAQELIELCLPKANNSIRIGITGVPGVGKSTFIEALGSLLIKLGKKVAILAIDPSSTISGGSILGDKTRMESLVRSDQAFIRPSPSGKSLGGVAQKTRESIILCEAAGYDVIIIETVGVGQSETAVHSMVDFFLLLKLAGAGDELQGIKRGIIEMADAIIINKADGDNLIRAKHAKNQFNKALHLYPPTNSGWTPKVMTCSALQEQGIQDIWNLILSYVSLTKKNTYFESHRTQQNEFWLVQTIEDQLKNNFYNNPTIKKALQNQTQQLMENKITPFTAANFLLNLHKETLS